MPLQAIADLLGVPAEDRGKLFDWSNQMIGSDDPARPYAPIRLLAGEGSGTEPPEVEITAPAWWYAPNAEYMIFALVGMTLAIPGIALRLKRKAVVSGAVWPRRTARSAPVRASQTRAVASELPVTTSVPSLLNAP